MFTNHTYDKGFASRIFKELLQLNNNINNPIKNGQRTYTFLQRRYRNDQETHKKVLSIISNQGNEHRNHRKCQWNLRTRKPSCVAGRNVKWGRRCGNICKFRKVLSIVPSLRYISKRMKTCIHTKTCNRCS